MKFWIARDRNYKRQLFLYVDKPQSYEGIWYSKGDCYDIDNRLFPEVTFKNSPMEVELVIKKKEQA